MFVATCVAKLADKLGAKVLTNIGVPLVTFSFFTAFFKANLIYMVFSAVHTKHTAPSLIMLAHHSLHFQFLNLVFLKYYFGDGADSLKMLLALYCGDHMWSLANR